MMDGIEQGEQFPGELLVAELSESADGPDGAVSVLAAILTDPGNVAFDITGIKMGFIKGRIEQFNQAGVAANEPPAV